MIDSGLDLASLRFRYRIGGDSPPWRPVRAFDDTRKVHIQFPARLDQVEAPPLFVVGADGEAVKRRAKLMEWTRPPDGIAMCQGGFNVQPPEGGDIHDCASCMFGVCFGR